jgi:enterochelin esterase family protein
MNRPLYNTQIKEESLMPQTVPSDSWPAASNVPGAEFPAIHADLRVTFRLSAPTAQSVQLQPGPLGRGAYGGLGEGTFDMALDDEGFWSVTIGPVVPGFHYYWFDVDGAAVNDPSSETYFGHHRQSSGVEVPEEGVDFYDPKDVPHGEVRARWYHSAVTGSWRRAYVYTPPDYDTQCGTRYPVLYLQHGGGEDERAWTKQGRANFILDNLIAAGAARPMIVVMDNGMHTVPGAAPAPTGSGVRDAQAGQRRSDAFEAIVIQELIPLIDSVYRTIPDRQHRAMAGLSMGAGQTAQIALGHLDIFSHVGLMSGGALADLDPETSYGGVFADADAFNEKVRLLWLSIGTAEWHRQPYRDLRENLDRLGVNYRYFESRGTSHEWQTWRKSLHGMAPLLFRE